MRVPRAAFPRRAVSVLVVPTGIGVAKLGAVPEPITITAVGAVFAR